jgi:hypothetical protein
MTTRFKCRLCYHVVDEQPCSVCGNLTPEPMCPRDHCHCSHPVVDGVAYCPDCGAAMCPICGSHDVAQVSRITGYLGDVSGWNAAKRQELKDRVRVEVT